MAKAFTIDGANAAAAVQKILKTTGDDGHEVVIRHETSSGNLTLEPSGGDRRPVEIENRDLQSWSRLVAAIRERAGIKPPSGKATCQSGIIRAKPRKNQKLGEPRFRVWIGRSTNMESPTKVTIRTAA